MAPPPSTQIERRPMTSKQARRKWQKNGCPTISPAERRRLEREAELERRAQKIRDDEKRKKDNARKRKEKQQLERENKKAMGVEEERTRAEGQIGLSQFFTRTTRSMAKTGAVTAISDQNLSPIKKVDASLIQGPHADGCFETKHEAEQGIVEPDHDTLDQHQSAQLEACPSSRAQDEQISPGIVTPKKQHWYTSPRKWKYAHSLGSRAAKLRPAEQHKPFNKPCPPVDAVSTALSQVASLQCLDYHSSPWPSSQQIGQTDSFPPLSLMVPEEQISPQRSNSLPSELLKRNLEQAGLDHPESTGDKAAIALKAMSNKRQRTSSFGCLTDTPNCISQFSSTSWHDTTTKSQQVVPSPCTDNEETVILNEATITAADNDQPPSSAQTQPESLNGGLSDKDFEGLDDTVSLQLRNHIELGKTTIHTEIQSSLTPSSTVKSKQWHTTQGFQESAISIKTNEENTRSKKSPREKSDLTRTQSAQSYVCDFSSQDFADLEELTEVPQQAKQSTSLLDSSEIQPFTSPAKTDGPKFDEFDLPGCTQVLAALVDPEINRLQPLSPDERKMARNTRSKTSMPPPPVLVASLQASLSSGNRRRLSARSDDQDGIYNCFAGSTQALLDL